MLSSIHPLGERAKGNRWGLTVSAFIVGAAIGGAVMGATFGLAGRLVRQLVEPSSALVLSLALAVVVVVVVIDSGWLGLRVPTVRRQVDETWLHRYRGWVYGAGFGIQLGLGIVTVVSSAAVYGTAALGFLGGSVAVGGLFGAAFGLIRGLAVLPGRVVTTPDRLRDFHRRLDHHRTLAAHLTPAAEMLVAVAVFTSLVVR